MNHVLKTFLRLIASCLVFLGFLMGGLFAASLGDSSVDITKIEHFWEFSKWFLIPFGGIGLFLWFKTLKKESYKNFYIIVGIFFLIIFLLS